MKDIAINEVCFIINIFKSPEIEYNASSMAKKIGITSMRALKIVAR